MTSTEIANKYDSELFYSLKEDIELFSRERSIAFADFVIEERERILKKTRAYTKEHGMITWDYPTNSQLYDIFIKTYDK